MTALSESGTHHHGALVDPDLQSEMTWVVYVAAYERELEIFTLDQDPPCLVRLAGLAEESLEWPCGVGVAVALQFSATDDRGAAAGGVATRLSRSARPGQVLATDEVVERLAFPIGWQPRRQGDGCQEILMPPLGDGVTYVGLTLANARGFLLSDPEGAVRRLDRLAATVDDSFFAHAVRWARPSAESYQALFPSGEVAERAMFELRQQLEVALWKAAQPPVLELELVEITGDRRLESIVSLAGRAVADADLGGSLLRWREHRSIMTIRIAAERIRQAEQLGLDFDVHGSGRRQRGLSRSIVRSADIDVVQPLAQSPPIEILIVALAAVAFPVVALIDTERNGWSVLGWGAVTACVVAAIFVAIRKLAFYLFAPPRPWPGHAVALGVVVGATAWSVWQWARPVVEALPATMVGIAVVYAAVRSLGRHMPRASFRRDLAAMLLLAVFAAAAGISFWQAVDSLDSSWVRVGLSVGLVMTSLLFLVIAAWEVVVKAVESMVWRMTVEKFPAEEGLDWLLHSALSARQMTTDHSLEARSQAVFALRRLADLLESPPYAYGLPDPLTEPELCGARCEIAANLRHQAAQLMMSRENAEPIAAVLAARVGELAEGDWSHFERRDVQEPAKHAVRARTFARSIGVVVPLVVGLLITSISISGLDDALRNTIGVSLIIGAIGNLVTMLDPRFTTETSGYAGLLKNVSELTPGRTK